MHDPRDVGYDKAFSRVRTYIEKYDRIFIPFRETYLGRPESEVYTALVQAFKAEGIEVWDEAIRDAARLIATGRPVAEKNGKDE